MKIDEMRMIEDQGIGQGSVNRVKRVGDTVRRPVGLWTPATHSLLKFLDKVGFDGVPKAFGIDEDGHEVLSYLHGEVAKRPWPDCLLRDSGLAEIVLFLKRYHETVRSYELPDDAKWYVDDVSWHSGHIIRHGDFGPWNTVWRDDKLVGVIDWDFIEPGDELDDIAQIAWYFVPLRGEAHWSEVGYKTRPDLKVRLSFICEAFGRSVPEVIQAILRLQQKEKQRMITMSQEGREPWVTFAGRGDIERIDADMAWLNQQIPQLV